MPWRLLPTKDVDGCDKPRGAAYPALIRGSPNGETRHEQSWHSRTEHIGRGEGTGGIETSQYPEERKTTVTPPVAASEKGTSPNPCGVKPDGVAACGVVGRDAEARQSL